MRAGLARVSRLLSGGHRALTSRLAPTGSKLFVVGDGGGWVLDNEAREVHRIAERLGLDATLELSGGMRGISGQRVYYTDQFVLPHLAASGLARRNACAIAYFHGIPRADEPVFTDVWRAFQSARDQWWRVHVSCRSMEHFVLEGGIDPARVHRIPIGVDPALFPPVTAASRSSARHRLGIPDSAVVAGSFQKDGIGWGSGDEPKLIKGPDVLVDVCRRLHQEVPELVVLLSGAARGFVRTQLSQHGIPHVHRWLDEYRQLAELYHACDVVLVTSREEGGPKAVLESMAAGVPLVSTRVGQAADLIHHGSNAWLAPVGDVESLVALTLTALALDAPAGRRWRAAARATAEAHSYDAQLPLWRAFFQ